MRAFMSDTWPDGASLSIAAAERMGSIPDPMLAVREARAILAEVENEHVGDYQRLTWLGDWSDDVAVLIAAFVNE